MQGNPKYLCAVGEVVVDHTRCAINNPLPVIAGVALTAVSLELAVAVLVTDLLVNGKVHLNELREFCALVRENKPLAFAKATVLLGEICFLHKITQAVRPEMQAAITRVSETFSKLGCCTAEGLGFVLAAESAGGVQPAVPLVNMIKKVAGTVEAIEERGVAAAKEALGKEAGIKTYDSLGTNKLLDAILKESTPGRVTQGQTTQYIKAGSYTDAVRDFESMRPAEITSFTTDKCQGLAGLLPDGRKIMVRTYSSDGRPTLEIKDGYSYIAVRYGNKP